jgi:N-acetylglucosaminyldiphosphoundecaprenol N-acetyl-beta-D-mannosaminyltransferase
MSMTTAAGTAESVRNVPTRSILGIPIAAVTLAEALDVVDGAIRTRRSLQIGVVNAAKIVNMARDAVLRDSVLSSDVVFADGMSVVWASRLLSSPLPERVAGIDLMTGMLERGRDRGYRVFCLGAADDVLRATVARIEQDYPGVTVAGSHHGYFDRGGEAEVARQIAHAAPDILFVAMTSPKKEEFLARWSSQLGVPVCHGVGGSFDVLAGKVQRAPDVWQRCGLEWLYRVKQEPARLWRRYLVTNILFCVLVSRALLVRIGRRAQGGLREQRLR